MDINAIDARPIAAVFNWIILGTKDEIFDLIMNNAKIRDTVRALHINIYPLLSF